MSNETMSTNDMSTNDLVEKYLDFAHTVVYHVAKIYRLNKDSIEDAKSAAYVGLIEAATKYKRSKDSAPFKNYAFFRIKGAIIDSFRKETADSNRYSQLAKAYQGVADIEENILSLDEQDKKDEKIAKVFDLVSKGALVFKLSKCEVQGDQIPDDVEKTPENQLLNEERKNLILKAVKKLPEKERLVIEEYYFNDKTFVEISNIHKQYSRSWLTRIHIKALEDLKEILKNEE